MLLASLSTLASPQYSSNAFYEWSVVSNPIENEATALTSVHMVDTNDGWAVGWMGAILHWDGVSWQSVSSPVGYDLFSIQMIEPDNGWIVGAAGTILHWNGLSWSSASSPTGNILRSIFMIDANEGWATGTSGTILHWDGTTWSLVSSPTGETLTSVFMISSSDGWMVGEGGTILHWDGTSWNNVASPTNLDLWDLLMVNSDDGWAVGTHALMSEYTILNWDGVEWSFSEGPSMIIGANLQSLYFLTANNGWAVGSGVIVYWDGSDWSLVNDPIGESVYRSIQMIHSTEGWAVGSEWVEIEPGHKEQRPRTIYYGPPTVVITASADITPDTLNLKSKGKWITCYIELPEEYDANNIDMPTIIINGTIPVDSSAPTEIGDYDLDGTLDAMVKFERNSVVEWLRATDIHDGTEKSTLVVIQVTGEVSGIAFEGFDTIKILLK